MTRMTKQYYSRISFNLNKAAEDRKKGRVTDKAERKKQNGSHMYRGINCPTCIYKACNLNMKTNICLKNTYHANTNYKHE